MPFIDINNSTAPALRKMLSTHPNVVASLCAAWCDVCKAYRPKFEALAKKYPELLFLWIDIEDQATLVGDMEVDNFPTLLLQQQDVVTFYGAMEPETALLDRMIQSQARQTIDQLKLHANAEKQRLWQVDANLILRIEKAD